MNAPAEPTVPIRGVTMRLSLPLPLHELTLMEAIGSTEVSARPDTSRNTNLRKVATICAKVVPLSVPLMARDEPAVASPNAIWATSPVMVASPSSVVVSTLPVLKLTKPLPGPLSEIVTRSPSPSVNLTVASAFRGRLGPAKLWRIRAMKLSVPPLLLTDLMDLLGSKSVVPVKAPPITMLLSAYPIDVAAVVPVPLNARPQVSRPESALYEPTNVEVVCASTLKGAPEGLRLTEPLTVPVTKISEPAIVKSATFEPS